MELTTWLTSPRALSSPTERVNSWVRSSNSLNKPDVLDGDDRLIGEGFEELDLRRGEGAHLSATRDQSSNEFPLLTKGNDQVGAPATAGTQPRKIILRADVGNMKRAMLAHPAILWRSQY